MFRYFFVPLVGAVTFPSFAHANAGGFDAMSLLPIVLIFAVFYFLLLRPQQQKMKAHQKILMELKRGDRIVTSGGIVGVVQKTTDIDAVVEIADGVRVTVMKQMITEVLSLKSQNDKSTPRSITSAPKKDAKPKRSSPHTKADVVSLDEAKKTAAKKIEKVEVDSETPPSAS